jgi:hypothetical protein
VSFIDPNNVATFIEESSDVVDITQEGTINHADKQTRAYSGGEKQ